MEKTTISTISFSHPSVESYIANTDAELNDFASLQAKEDSQKRFCADRNTVYYQGRRSYPVKGPDGY